MWEINAKNNSDWKDQRDILYILDREYQPLRLSQSHKGSKTTYAFMLKQMIPFLKLDMISLEDFLHFKNIIAKIRPDCKVKPTVSGRH